MKRSVYPEPPRAGCAACSMVGVRRARRSRRAAGGAPYSVGMPYRSKNTIVDLIDLTLHTQLERRDKKTEK